jgi:LacI family transcriptional regulator
MRWKGTGGRVAVTIKQIAEFAKVSRGTVDKVLNGRPGVKTETRERVLKIAKELNYKPNYIGKALVMSKEKTRMGVILTPEYNPFVHEVIQGIHRAQEEFQFFGIEIVLKMLSTLEPAEQIGILNYFENENLAGVAVFPLNDEQVIEKINLMRENGMAVITFNSQISSINDICFIGQNHYRGGRTAAGLMSKLLPGGGNIGIIISSKTLSCHQYRLKGFEDNTGELGSNLNIVEIRENQDRTETAFQITLEYIKAFPNLKGIYITGGGCAGVGRALEITGLAGKVKVICHDVLPDIVKLLKNGTVDFTLGQNPELQGYLLIKTLFDYLIKQQAPDDKIIDIPIEIYTADTVD